MIPFTMKKLLFFVCAGLGCSLLAGCGGTSTGGTTTTTVNSPFVGVYDGLWQGASGDSGSMNVVVNENGAVGGTFTESGVTGPLSGSIAGTGALVATATFSNGTDNLTGTLTQNGNTLTGMLLEQGLKNQQINVEVSQVNKIRPK